MSKVNTIGWDIGGAHLKLVVLDQEGNIIFVDQIETPLWKGLEVLEQAIASVPRSLIDTAKGHGITMTGELADIFPDRITGVRELIKIFTTSLNREVSIYAANKGWLDCQSYAANELSIASANWYATAQFIAKNVSNGLLLDIGSTTTDIIPILDGEPAHVGFTDSERLQSEELVYTGVNRTPVSSLVSKLPFMGEWQQIATEYFATMGDVYCLTEDLPENAGFSTADGGGTSLIDCARRLARVVGRDLNEADLSAWQELAKYISGQHIEHIGKATARIRSRYPGVELPIIGAGAGRFLIRRLAQWHNVSYHDFADLLHGDEMLKQAAAICAPASACAALLS